MGEEPQRPEFRSQSAWGLRALVVVGIAIIVAYLALRPAGEPSGIDLPDFGSLEYISEEGNLTASDLEGRPVVVNFWASWCDPCRREMPLLDAMAGRYSDSGLLIVGINVQDRLDAAREFLEEIDVNYPIVEDLDQRLFAPLREESRFSTYLPQTYFLTAEGDVVDDGVAEPRLGELDEDELEAAIRYLLDNPR